MSAAAVSERLQKLRTLVKKLEEEHRGFASDIGGLDRELQATEEVERLKVLFVLLRDSLTEHMLVEEFEVYPELMGKDLSDSSISSIMQQHHDVSSYLGKMEVSLRLGDFPEFKRALGGLAEVLRLHQPAEEQKVFPLAIN